MNACSVLITCVQRSWLRPHIGRSRDFNRPWSASIRLAYCSVWCQAPGASVMTSTGVTLVVFSARVKNRALPAPMWV